MQFKIDLCGSIFYGSKKKKNPPVLSVLSSSAIVNQTHFIWEVGISVWKALRAGVEYHCDNLVTSMRSSIVEKVYWCESIMWRRKLTKVVRLT